MVVSLLFATALVGPPLEVAQSVRLELVVSGLNKPCGLAFAPGDPAERFFVLEQHVGKVRVVRDGKLLARPFLDLSGQVSTSNEQGLLGIAFHPRFRENLRFFINSTDRQGTTRVVEYRVATADADVALSSPVRTWLSVPQPFPNHNGGHLVFGPDGKLYIGLGDGGAADDPQGNGQRRDALLGKMLRLDVDTTYVKPPEVWLIGLRNPWRYAFDQQTGDLYIGDVGQNDYEEVDIVPAGSAGANLGWNVMEGLHCFRATNCRQQGLMLPVLEYDHRTGCSITGGVVYRGKALPALAGHYFYADYCSGLIRSFRWDRQHGITAQWDWKSVLDPRRQITEITTFGADRDGEIYLAERSGKVFKLTSPAGRQ